MHFPILAHYLTLVIDYKMSIESCFCQPFLLNVLGQKAMLMTIIQSGVIVRFNIKFLLKPSKRQPALVVNCELSISLYGLSRQ